MVLKIYEDLKSKYQPGLDNFDILNKADNKYNKFRFQKPEIEEDDPEEIKEFLGRFNSTGIFTEKLKAYCEFSDTYKDSVEILSILNSKIKNPKFKTYYNYFGTSGCRANSYQDSILMSLLGDSTKEEKLKAVIISTFKPGDRYTSKEIKEMLRVIYKKLDISRTPKATDLGEYFKLQETKKNLIQ